MSIHRQPPLWIRSLAVRYSPGTVLEAHTHDWDQLLYASEGVMSVTTPEGTWVVPAHRAVWIPAETEHEVECSGWVFLRTLYLAPGLPRRFPRACAVVPISPLTRELILRVVQRGALSPEEPTDRHLAECLLDQIETLESVALDLPSPRDEAASRVAERLRKDPALDLSLEELARQAGVGRRTLERRFLRETGMTLGRWRQQARLLHALRLLAAGDLATRVALEVGYESPSAFIAAFRRAFGTTPARFYADRG